MTKTLLSSSVTIAQYRLIEADKKREEITDFIQKRFIERYITPLRGDRNKKHGFCTMAISCLLIETLESFEQGWSNSDRKSKEAFRSFFQRCLQQDSVLRVFNNVVDDFYSGVRCGILHQAETTNGWRIRRDGSLLDSEKKTINATIFHDELEKYLKNYCKRLKTSEWDSEIWRHLRKKMNTVIENCKEKTE